MKFSLTCIACAISKSMDSCLVPAVYNDSGRYEMICSVGHKRTVILNSHKFEVLFEVGASAMVDGYFREATTTWAASLERFYEYAISIFLLRQGLSEQQISDVWKEVASQSERQYGAFILLWTSAMGEKPVMLSQAMVKFRNDVIHKGKIPNEQETYCYGEAALSFIRSRMKTLRERYPDEVTRMADVNIERSRKPADEGVLILNLQLPTNSFSEVIAPNGERLISPDATWPDLKSVLDHRRANKGIDA
jgi:hypothetical protein